MTKASDRETTEGDFRALFENSPDAIFVESFQGEVLDANPAAARLHGIPRERLVGMNVVDLVPPELRKAVRARLRPPAVLQRVEGYSLTADGRSVPVELSSAVFEYQGAEALLLHVRDVSERQRDQEELQALRRLSQRLSGPLQPREIGRVIAEEARAVFAHDFLEVCYYDEVSRAAVSLHCEDTPLGATEPVEMPLEARVPRRVWVEATLINRDEGEIETDMRLLGDVTRRSRSLLLTPIPWAGRSMVGMLTVQSYTPGRFQQRDLGLLEMFASQCGGAIARVRWEAERERFEDKVRQAQKLESLGVLAGGVAHDFNNLLVGMLGYADLAADELPPASSARESIREIEIAAKRAAELCRQLLAYSGKAKFVVEEVALNDVVSEIGSLLDVSISKKARLEYRLNPQPIAVKADVTQLRQVVMNLITNASEAIGDRPGVITVRTGQRWCDVAYLGDTYLAEDLPEGHYAYVEVEDTGAGMDAETRRRIFDPFFTTKFAGRGLGLAAALGIVRAHGGAVSLRSEPGQGTIFRVLFPVVSERSRAARRITEVGAEWTASGTVLLVDDEEPVRQVGTRMLKRIGFDVLTAADGRAGVETFRENKDDIVCVLLDLTMPHLDGEDVLRQITLERGDVRVVLSTGAGEQETAERFAEFDLAGFLPKPYRFVELRRAMRRALEGA